MTRPQAAKVAEILLPGEVAHGDCIGADAEFHAIAEAASLVIYLFPTNDGPKKAHCSALASRIAAPKADPLARNKDIVRWSERMIAAPRGAEVLRSGTWSTIRFAQKIGVPVTIVMPDGSQLFRGGAREATI